MSLVAENFLAAALSAALAWPTARRGPSAFRTRPDRQSPIGSCASAPALSRKHIASTLAISPATVSRVLARAGLSRLKDLEPVRRYERDEPGDMIHIDIKKLNRFNEPDHRVTRDRAGGRSVGAGWEYVHVCIDDASRVAFSQILPDERKERAVAFLEAALAYYASLGVNVSRVITDNGSCYRSKAFAKACRTLDLKHIRTKPYTPKTNGKAERFIQTALREWAYAAAYPTSKHRAAELPV